MPAAGAGIAVATSGLGAVSGAPALASTRGSGGHAGDRGRLFPPLRPDPLGRLALPPGFSYEVVSVSGQTDIHDGRGTVIGKTPERPDGTAAVTHRSRWRLIQNHEARPGAKFPVPLVKGTVYDPGALGGGCTVVETNRHGQRISEWVGLSGTYSNCAGGITPWDSWLTCEETEAKAGTGTLTKDHGYVFEVLADAPQDQVPRPIKASGRFPHEAVVVEPGRERVYLTEDASNPNGLLYRWTAPAGYRLRPGSPGP